MEGNPTLGIVDANLSDDQAALPDQEAKLQSDQSNLDFYTAQRDADSANFDPEGAAGPRPEFNEPTPQDHMQDVMRVSPLLMALGAVGGAFTKQHGITMLASTNAMMKGVVQGDADAYKSARENYEQQYENFRDKSKTWLDVYKAYSTAYKGRIDADKLAVIGANNAVGADRADVKMTKKDIAQMIQIRAGLDKQHEKVIKDSADIETARIRAAADAEKAGAATKNATTNANRVDTASSKATQKTKEKQAAQDADNQEVLNMGDDLSKQLQGKFAIAGRAGGIRKLGETIGNATGLWNDESATKFRASAALWRTKVTALLRQKGGKMGADERHVLADAANMTDEMLSSQQGQTKIEAVSKLLRGGFKDGAPVTKTIKGVTYTQRDGKWYAN